MNNSIIDIESLSEADISEILENSPVLLIGSVISIFEPTNLPNGSAFTEAMFDYIFPEYLDEQYFWFRDEFNKLPFEALMECFPNLEELLKIIKTIFSVNSYNPLHSFIGDGLINGKISSIITPNYDLAFDHYLENKKFTNIVRCENDVSQTSNATYFKIHGCVTSMDEPPICTLTQEENLPDWKRKLLQRILKNKTLIIIGYSGRDFDICPILKNKSIYEYERIIWLSYKQPNTEAILLTAYAEDLLSNSTAENPNIIIRGDLVQFVNKFFKGPERVNIGHSNFDPPSCFGLTNQQLCLWQIGLLNRLAYTTLGLEKLNASKSVLNNWKFEEMRWHMHRYKGQYKMAANIALDSLILLNKTSEPEKYLRALYTVSGCLLTYGDYISAIIFFNKAKKFKDKYLKEDSKIKFNLLNQELALYLYLSKVTWVKYFYFIRKYLKFRAWNLICDLQEMSRLGHGTLKEKQRVRLSLEGFKKIMDEQIPNEKRTFEKIKEFLSEIVVPLESLKGFMNMGLPPFELIAFRSDLKQKIADKNFSETQIYELKRNIERARLLGINSELWKLARLMVKFGKNSGRDQMLEFWKEWHINLKICQYNPIRKVFLIAELYQERIRLIF